MRNRISKAALLPAILVLALAPLWASGGKEAASAPAGKASSDPLGKYEPGIVVTTAQAVDDTFKFPKGDSIENNVWTREYKDALGITVNYAWLVSTGTQYEEKVNVVIASGDLPDFLRVNKTQLARLAKTDLIRKDLQDIYQKNAAPFLDSIAKQEGTTAFDAATFSGNLIGLPSTGSSIDGAPMLWLRVDWLDKLGLKAPATYDEFLKVLDAFVSKDPAGTGKADYVGLALNKDLTGGYAGYEGFANMLGAYPTIWVQKDGKLVYGSYQPEMRKVLQELQKLYAAGKIDKEFAVKDGGKVSELSVNGRNGMQFGQMWNPLWPLQANKDLDPKADWQAFALPGSAKAQISLGTGAWYVVNKKAKNPEALVKMLNLQTERFWGATSNPPKFMAGNIDGAFYEYHKFSIFTAWPAYKNLTIYRKIVDALKSGNTSAMNPEEVDMFTRNDKFKKGDNKEWGYARVFGELGSFKTMESYVQGKSFMMNAFYGADTPTQAAKWSSIYKLEQETFAKIIMGDNIGEFDKFVESVKKLGYSDIEKEVNDWYATAKK